MQEILQNLNKEQLEAVLYNDGPLLLLAGAGTGKTRVLTSKIAYIIKNNMAFPSEILAVTFTNKAANEMKERVASMTNLNVTSMWINTFHSVAARILRQHGDLIGIDRNFTIADSSEQLTIIKQIMKDFEIDTKEYSPKYYSEIISKIKDKMNKNAYSLYMMDEVYDSYCNRLKQMNICDFSDLLVYNIKLFNERSEIKEYYNNKFKYILVDEYQDTNFIQHQWLKLVSGIEKNKNINITCVGDDDQSIYGWRGAELENILKFTNDYSRAKVLKLEKNYRSTENILNTASTLISYNKDRHKKILYSNKNDKNEKVRLTICNDTKQEAIVVVGEIENLKKSYSIKNYRDIGILVRAGYQTRVFEDIFLKYGIPYRVIGGLKFYERKEIKDCVAYLKLVNNSSDYLAFERVINVPKRGIGSATISKIREFASENDMGYIVATKNLCESGVIKGKTKEQILLFINKISEWRSITDQMTVRSLMQTIIIETNFRNYIEKDNEIETKTKLENIDEFLNMLDDFSNLQEFLEYVSLVNDNDGKSTNDSVNIMTIHAAKGLEFDTVFLPNWQEGIFPNPKALEEKKEIEEERRLAYVAITRAKEKLYISYSKHRYEYGEVTMTDASRFVEELPRDSIEIADYSNSNYYGDYYEQTNNYIKRYTNITKSENTESIQKSSVIKKCIHKTFGEGYIKKEDGDKLTIIFKKSGEKTILKNFVEIL